MRLACVILLLMVCYPSISAQESVPEGIITLNGEPAPALALSNTEGEAYDLKASQAQWKLVHFWASWCGPCRREMPTLQQLYHEIDQNRIEIVLVNTAETEDEIFNFLGIVAPDLYSLMDSDGSVTENWSPRGLPSTYIVDKDNRLRYLVLGGRNWMDKSYLNFLKNLGKD